MEGKNLEKTKILHLSNSQARRFRLLKAKTKIPQSDFVILNRDVKMTSSSTTSTPDLLKNYIDLVHNR